MAKKAIDYELEGRQGAAEGRTQWSSGVPRTGWQHAAWMKGWNGYFADRPKEPVEVTPVDTVVVHPKGDHIKMIQARLGKPAKRGVKRRMEALVATMVRRQAARLWA